MRVIVVSRHRGAVNYIRSICQERSLRIDLEISHVEDRVEIDPGDIVIGTLPLVMAAQVTEAGAKFYNLEVEVPKELRGKELSMEELTERKACLVLYEVNRGDEL